MVRLLFLLSGFH